jgi:uncharacterized protein (UPF0333 family)
MEITGESLRLQDVENFFKYAINPSLIETKIEKQATAMMKERGGISMNLVLAVGIVFVAAAIAYTIIAGVQKNSEWVNKYVNCNNQLKAQNAQTGVVQSTQEPTQPTQTQNTVGSLPIAVK